MTKTTKRIALTIAALASVLSVSVGSAASASAQSNATPYEQKLYRLADNVWKHGKPCSVEDGSSGPLPCYWDAGNAGNGIGESFVILKGRRYGKPVQIYVYRSGGIEI